MFHTLTLSQVRPEGEGAVALGFEVPAALAQTFRFTPGQYLTLRSGALDGDQRRAYSIASLPGEDLTVGVKSVPGGAFSPFAQRLRPGDQLEVMPPEGRFLWQGAQKIVLIAAGSGITPMISIAGAALEAGAEVTLIYGNRTTGSIMFRETLDQLKDRFLTQFTLVHVLSREPQDVALLNGRVTGERVMALAQAGAVDLASAQAVYLCGPGEMIDDVSAALAGHVASDALHFERFTADGAPAPARSVDAERAAEAGVQIDVVLDGTRRSFALKGEDASLIEAAARAGLELPFSCKGGMCCTCRCKVVEGTAEMAVNYSLEAWELAAGFTLACQARPTTDRLVLDFDAA